ncbi:hypothetical protein [Chryseobacterium sp. M5A1_1a]
MKNIIKFLVPLLLIISFSLQQWLDISLKNNIRYINKRNIEHLEFKTNKNFIQFGIENIGSNLREELLRIDIDNANIKPVNGMPFYFFQENEVTIFSKNKIIVIYLSYDWYHSVFKIKGYQTL